MPRGYRYIVFATLGWLCLTGASDHQGRQRQNRNNQAQTEHAVTAPRSGKPVNDPGDAKSADLKCKDDRGNEANCTVVATDAALEQARDADWQAWAAVGGIVIGFFTLLAAVAAAFFAMKTWGSAKEAVSVAEDEFRPWINFELKIEGIKKTGENDIFISFSYQTTNDGKYPATDVEIRTSPYVIYPYDEPSIIINPITERDKVRAAYEQQLTNISTIGETMFPGCHSGTPATGFFCNIGKAVRSNGDFVVMILISAFYKSPRWIKSRVGQTSKAYVIYAYHDGAARIPSIYSLPLGPGQLCTSAQHGFDVII
ncbi:hypothetical protein [Sphingomonas sp. CARO-RG-8B-R24-01]|uniref:hypothetical protein n=1 Tax=Sphingomonas sp. CARO-RG-8B-R24-01 TaxID=2914831 RepID=UPI001F572FEB|nr:hypothetical protein [Sphingomonas sp. CARO-RG-8B-R24-01]